jgi:hypothetical protein
LTREEFGLASGQTLVDVSGANTALRGNAPAPTADVAGPAQNVSHPDLPTFGQIAYLDVSQVKGATTGTQVVNDLPKAIGEYAFTSGAGTNPTFWFQNQIQVGDPNQTDFLLNPLDHVLQMLRVGQVRAPASSTAEATAVSPASTRKVEATATAQFVGLNLFPTTYITAPGSGVPAVVKVDSFSANVQCKSTAGGATYPAVATGTWTAVLKYWADPANDGSFIAGVPVLGKTNGGYVTVGVSNNLPLAGSVGGAARDIMAEIGNPLVYDDADNARDVYLFKTPTTKGYLQSMSVNPNIKATADPSGRTTEVKIQNAIQLVTFQTDPTNEASAITLNIGNLSCEAADKRG